MTGHTPDETGGRRLYGTTWNSNPSGVLWSCRWYIHADGTGSAVLDSPGVFVSPTQYADEATLRTAFTREADRFFGALADMEAFVTDSAGRPGETEAVEAAHRATCHVPNCVARFDAEVAVDAAYPIIAEAVRAETADEVRALRAENTEQERVMWSVLHTLQPWAGAYIGGAEAIRQLQAALSQSGQPTKGEPA